MRANVYLVGFMGSGKSEVGRVLAARLSATFVDLDELLVERLGSSIAEFFAAQGEAAFRREETAVLKQTGERSGLVIATGGGAFCSPSNQEIIHGSGGLSVFLDVPWKVIEKRLPGQNQDRPMWKDVQQARALFFDRRRWYLQAKNRVDVGETTSPEEVADRVLDVLRESDCAT
jgi:shikimate kinase